MIIANRKYNKTTFTERWRQIVNDHNVGDKLVTSNLAFVKGACKISEKYRRQGYAAQFKAKIMSLPFGKGKHKRNVKGIAILAYGMRKYLYISQSDILKELFPPKTEDAQRRKNRAEVLKMMRVLIQPQIDTFKRNWTKRITELKETNLLEFQEQSKCPLTGKNLTLNKVAIDHKVPFIEIAKEFWRINGVDPFTARVMGGGMNIKFEEDHLNLAWIEYHRKNSVLQATDAKANMSKGQKSMEEFLDNEQKGNQFKSRPRTL